MKTVYLLFLGIIICGTLLTQTANCQWYSRQFSVESINDLTENQSIIALTKANKKIESGQVTIIVGLGVILAGAEMILKSAASMNLFDESSSGSMMPGLVGIGLITFVGIPCIPIGASLWAIGAKRKSDIEKVFGKSVSHISFSPQVGWHQGKGVVGGQIVISI